MTRADLAGPGVRVLNRGGFANPDVLFVERSEGPQVVVKDYGCRSPLVRRCVAPLLVRHERAMLERVAGLPGVPAPAQPIDSLAVSMEFVEGLPLRRRSHRGALPPAFFDALEGILDGLAQRGVAYLDLSSPTNILSTPSGAPALVDFGSAFALPLPRTWVARLERRALRKLHRRFAAESPEQLLEIEDPGELQLDLGRVRFRLVDRGRLGDPVPALLLPDAGLGAELFAPLLAAAGDCSRRAVAVDMPGFGGSRGPRWPLAVTAYAGHLERLLDGLRILRADLVGWGWGGLVARALALRCPRRVRALATIDTPVDRLQGRFLARWRAARDDARALRERLGAELPPGLSEADREQLQRALRSAPGRRLRRVYRAIPIRRGIPGGGIALARIGSPTQPWLAIESEPPPEGSAPPLDPRGPSRTQLWPEPLREPERFWAELAQLAGGAA